MRIVDDRRISSRLVALLGAALLALPSAALAAPSTNWMDYTVVAREKIVIGSNLNIGGSFATIESGGLLRFSQGSFQLDGAPDPLLAADDLTLGQQTSVVDVYAGTLDAHPTAVIRGSLTEPHPFPLPIVLPPLPAQSTDPCTESAPDIVVAAGATRVLSPGCYGELTVKKGGMVILEPGEFLFFKWTIKKQAQVLTQGGGDVDVYIRRRMKTEDSAEVRASSGDPTELQFWIASENNNKTVIGRFGTVIATIYAPDDPALNFNKDVTFIGSAVGRVVDIRGSHQDRPPTPTPSPSPSPSPTPSPSPSPSPMPTPSPTSVVPPTPSPSPSPSPTPSPTPTMIPSPSPTSVVPPTPTPFCKEDPNAICTVWVIEDPMAVPPAYDNLQDAVDAATGTDVVCVYARTTENVVINEGHELEITQCTVAEVTAADPAQPVVLILGTDPVLVIGLDATGGTVGWQVDGSGHELSGVRSYDNTVDGILVNGNDNAVQVNRVEHNAECGIRIAGNGNRARTGKYTENGYGICVEGSNNELRNVDAEDNVGDGVVVSGSTNELRSVGSNRNGGNGFNVSGGSTNELRSNDGEDNIANGVLIGAGAMGTIVRDNKMDDNGLCEYDVLGAGTTDNGGSNRANGVKFFNIEDGGCFE